MQLKYFQDVTSESELSKQYRKLAKKMHPDTAKTEEELIEKQKQFSEMSDEYMNFKTYFEMKKYVQDDDEEEKPTTRKNLVSNQKKIVQQTAEAVRKTIAAQYTTKEKEEIKENATIFVQSLLSPLLNKIFGK